ncbi:MAG: hexapeptide repeat-containing transferase [Solirubrobacterales bacterium]|nr:hexapeptide repeat-containing transferase [Solirubrobacterales bacterium]
MALTKVEVSIHSGTPESRDLVGRVQRAIGLTERLNRIPYDDREAIREAWSELTGTVVDEAFHLIPPLYSDHGLNIRVGRSVFINQACILNDIGGIEIGDEVMIGPRVSLLTAGHPLDPGRRRRQIVAAPIVIERAVWLGAGATVLQGVTVGSDAVVAAGAVVTRDVPPRTLVAGVPAQVLREIAADEDTSGSPI